MSIDSKNQKKNGLLEKYSSDTAINQSNKASEGAINEIMDLLH